MIKSYSDSDLPAIDAVINDAAVAYRGVIPADRWHEPYMPRQELEHEIADGVRFWGFERAGELIGVMGMQDVQDVTLIRHAYVRTVDQGKGIGRQLLHHLLALTPRPVLIGTWSAAVWAISFYTRNGFALVTESEKNTLLKRYWTVPDRQIATSVVLADGKWRTQRDELRLADAAHSSAMNRRPR